MRGTDLVRLLELRLCEGDLAADLDGDRIGQTLGEAVDLADDVADVLAVTAVPAGDDLHQTAGAIPSGHGSTVDLRLHGEPALRRAAQTALDRGAPCHQALGVEDVVQAQETSGVRDVADGRCTVGHEPRGGVRGDLGGVLLLPGLHRPSELIVRSIVQDAVAVTVVRLRGLAQELERGLVLDAVGHGRLRLSGGKSRHEGDPLLRV